MNQKVFISYSRKDKEIVTTIKAELYALTSASFLMCDYDMEGIPEQYVLDAVHGINECDVFLFMLSEHSLLSEIPLMELAYANNRQASEQKKIYIVNIDGCAISDSFLFRWGKYRTFNWNNDKSRSLLVFLLKQEKTNSNFPKLHDIYRNGKYGFVNHEGEIVIQCKWTKVDNFREGLAVVDDSSGKYGYLDLNGNRLIPCMWDKAEPFEDGMAVVKVKFGAWDYKSGVIDKDNNLIIPTTYNSLEYIGDGLFKHFQSGPNYGIVNKDNEIVSTPYWYSIGRFYDGLCPVQEREGEHRYGYIDRTGKLVIPFWWNSANRFSEGLAIVQDKDRKYGVIDIQGNVLIPCYHERLQDFHEGLCAFEKDGKTGFINKEDEIVIDAEWKTISYFTRFNSGRCLVQDEDGKYGYINKTGSLVISYTWNDAEDFDNDTAWVKVDDTWKLIDIDGNYV